MTSASRGQMARAALGAIITGVFLWMLLRRIDMGRVVHAMMQVKWYILPLSVMFLVVGYAARVVRWWWMLRACNPHIGLGDCVRPLLVSVAVNNVVPLRVGDALRIVGFRKQLRAPVTRIAATLLIERILDATVLFVFLAAGITYLKGSGSSIAYAGTAVTIGCAIAVIWTIMLLFGRSIESWLRRVSRHRVLSSRGLSDTLEGHIQEVFAALNIVRAPVQLLRFFLISAIIWGFEGAVFAAVAWGLSFPGHWYGPWFAFASGTFATLLPSSPGYVGTFDFFAMSGLAAFGASRSLSAAFAFLVHMLLWLPLTTIGLAYMLLPPIGNSRLSLRTISSGSRDAD